MTTSKGKAKKAKSFLVLNIEKTTYEVIEDSTIEDVEKKVKANRNPIKLNFKSPKFQAIEIPKRGIHSLFA